MKLIVNDQPHEQGGNGRLGELLAELKAPSDRVAVMVNGDIVPRKDRDSFQLMEGDRVEILTFAGGG
jgi:thiamine biosynthesis protein ThiS